MSWLADVTLSPLLYRIVVFVGTLAVLVGGTLALVAVGLALNALWGPILIPDRW